MRFQGARNEIRRIRRTISSAERHALQDKCGRQYDCACKNGERVLHAERILFIGAAAPAELKAAQQAGDFEQIENELGDVLFSVVNVSRFLKVDPEQALTGASNKFLDRYLKVEALAAARGIDMPSTPIEELDKLWAEAKKQESN